MPHHFSPAWFARNPHVQTLWGKFVRPHPPVATIARRLTHRTPDGDRITTIRLDAPTPDAPRLLLLHGLEGTERSHYVESLFAAARLRGWGADLLLFRSCDGQLNDTPRFYHSGETGDAAWFLHSVATEFPQAPLFSMGVSLGGNVLVKLLGEPTHTLPTQLRAAAAISVPFDLARGSRHIDSGFSRIYSHWFLRTLRDKALGKRDRFPDHFPSADSIAKISTLWEFDDLITGPLHGFDGALDYYTRSSAKQFVQDARIPLLLVSAIDDPFLPADVLDEVRERTRHAPNVALEFVPHGGHVGFVAGPTPWRTRPWLADRIPAFFDQHLPSAGRVARAVTTLALLASALIGCARTGGTQAEAGNPPRPAATGPAPAGAPPSPAATGPAPAGAPPSPAGSPPPPVNTPPLPLASAADADTQLVDIRDLEPTIRVAARYATADNFTGAPLPGYEANRALLRRPAAESLARAQRTLAAQGYGLLVWDAYRPVRATLAMVDWTRRTGNQHLLEQGYIASRSRHNLGLAIDLTLVRLADGREVPMGTPFDTFSSAAHTANASGDVRVMRQVLVQAMESAGFRNYDQEWWHFSFELPNARPFDVPIVPRN